MRFRGLVLACTVSLCVAAGAQAAPPVGVDASCDAPAGNPAPGSPEWQQRDTQNQYCSTLRLRDQFLSPAFGHGNLVQGAALWVDQAAQQADEPGHPHGGVTTLIPGSQAADPFRTIKRWTEAGLGRVAPVKFDSRTLVACCSWSAGMTWSGGSGAENECIGCSGRVCDFAGGTVCAGERV